VTAPRPAPAPDPFAAQRWRNFQELWFATLRRPWASLAVVPAHAGVSCLDVAKSLADVARMLRRQSVMLLSGEGLDLAATAKLVYKIREQQPQKAMDEPPLIVVALESVISNPTGIAIGLAADAALLCVQMGTTDIASARHTVEMLGRDRFVGAVLVGEG
jgi:hypothetical protein